MLQNVDLLSLSILLHYWQILFGKNADFYSSSEVIWFPVPIEKEG